MVRKVLSFFLVLAVIIFTQGCGLLLSSDSADNDFDIPEGFNLYAVQIPLPNDFTVQSYAGDGTPLEAFAAFRDALDVQNWAQVADGEVAWDAHYGLAEEPEDLLTGFFHKDENITLLQSYPGSDQVYVTLITGPEDSDLMLEPVPDEDEDENGEDDIDENEGAPVGPNDNPDDDPVGGDDTRFDDGAVLPDYLQEQIDNLPAAPSLLVGIQLPARQDWRVQVSPNGRWILFSAENYSPDGTGPMVTTWYLYDVSSGALSPEQTTPGSLAVIWSPDSAQFLFYDFNAELDYYTYNPIDGSSSLLHLPSNSNLKPIGWFTANELVLGGHFYEAMAFDVNTEKTRDLNTVASRVKHCPLTGTSAMLLEVRHEEGLYITAGYTGFRLPHDSVVLGKTVNGYLAMTTLDRETGEAELGFYPDMDETPTTVPLTFFLDFGYDNYYFPAGYAHCMVLHGDYGYFGYLTEDLTITLTGIVSGGPGVAPGRLTYAGDYLVVERDPQTFDLYEINP